MSVLPAVPWPTNVAVEAAIDALFVRLNMFDPLVMVIVGDVLDVGGPAKLPVALPGVAPFVTSSSDAAISESSQRRAQ